MCAKSPDLTAPSTPVPADRISRRNDRDVREEGKFVLYWMIAARRTRSNHGLDRAIAWAETLGKPLLILEALRVGYRWSSPRLHRFVIDGMAANQRACDATPVTYYPYVEPSDGDGRGLLETLSNDACVIVTDHFPCFFLPAMVNAAAGKVSCRLEAVDSNGLLPLSVAGKAFPTAYAFRRFLQKTLPDHFEEVPNPDPLDGLDLKRLPKKALAAVQAEWPPAPLDKIDDAWISALPLESELAPGEGAMTGGAEAAHERLDDWIETIDRYADGRNQPDTDATSGLSPYLHFGHIGSTEVVGRLLDREDWTPDRVSGSTSGKRSGWWGASESTEAYLDQIITWRELGYVAGHYDPKSESYEGVPEWARRSLAEHASDPRETEYDLDTLDRAETHDEVWNAAQRQLVREGVMHNYLRMLWGKKVLEWSATPAEAFDALVELNNRYALDGRNPNSYSAISWIFGRYDRAWGPEREIFGKIRYMSSDNTKRKLRLKEYLAEYDSLGESERQGTLF